MGGFGGSGLAAAQALSLLFSAAFLTYWLIIFSSYLRRRPGEAGDGSAFSWHLFVPCRDEAAVIGDTVGYLRATFPAATVWVIDDDSDDATGAIAERFRVVDPLVQVVSRRLPEARTGKGDALNTAYRRLRASLDDDVDPALVIVGVVDADGRPSPNSFDACAGPLYFGDDRVGGVQVEVRIMNTVDRRPLPGRGLLANLFGRTLVRMQDIEFRSVIGAIQCSRGRTQTVGMGGNGQYTRLSSLIALDEGDGRAWRGSLLEDYELGLHLLLAGHRTAYSSDAWVDQEGIPSFRRYLTQRTRWGQGVMQCIRYLPRAWNSPNLTTTGALETSYYLFQPWLTLVGSIVFPIPLVAVVVNQSKAGSSLADFLDTGGWVLIGMYLVLGTTPFWLWGPLYRKRCAPESRLTAFGWGFAYLFYVYDFYVTSWRAALRFARGKHGWSKTRRNSEFATGRPADEPLPSLLVDLDEWAEAMFSSRDLLTSDGARRVFAGRLQPVEGRLAGLGAEAAELRAVTRRSSIWSPGHLSRVSPSGAAPAAPASAAAEVGPQGDVASRGPRHDGLIWPHLAPTAKAPTSAAEGAGRNESASGAESTPF